MTKTDFPVLAETETLHCKITELQNQNQNQLWNQSVSGEHPVSAKSDMLPILALMLRIGLLLAMVTAVRSLNDNPVLECFDIEVAVERVMTVS